MHCVNIYYYDTKESVILKIDTYKNCCEHIELVIYNYIRDKANEVSANLPIQEANYKIVQTDWNKNIRMWCCKSSDVFNKYHINEMIKVPGFFFHDYVIKNHVIISISKIEIELFDVNIHDYNHYDYEYKCTQDYDLVMKEFSKIYEDFDN